jgi:hypothetical protein
MNTGTVLSVLLIAHGLLHTHKILSLVRTAILLIGFYDSNTIHFARRTGLYKFMKFLNVFVDLYFLVIVQSVLYAATGSRF